MIIIKKHIYISKFRFKKNKIGHPYLMPIHTHTHTHINVYFLNSNNSRQVPYFNDTISAHTCQKFARIIVAEIGHRLIRIVECGQ